VLDNCEHLIEVCATFSAKLLQHCPGLQILATSREGLNIPGEVNWRVPSLTLPGLAAPKNPGPINNLLHNEAVRLFMERAIAGKPDFKLSEKNIPV
jgi:predicted ATPase